MFNLFAELVAFHLHSLDLMEQSNAAVAELNRQLTDSMYENRQYNYISHHNLQEPLRKIRIFSDMLVNTTATLPEADKTKDLALKINTSAQRFSMMIKDLSEYSELNDKDVPFEDVDLNKIIKDVCAHLQPQLTIRQALFSADVLPVIPALPLQMEQLFYHLVHNALKFSKRHITPVIHVSAIALSPDHVTHLPGSSYFEIRITDNGIGIDAPQLEKIFDIFSQLSYNEYPGGFGIGLAYCRKIVRNHRGIISAQSEPGKGTTFSIILPAGPPAAAVANYNGKA
jgi:signal transduction histidine kinase